MKKLFKAVGTIAMLAALVLSFSACDDLMGLFGDDKGNDNYNLGKTLTLSGQVYVPKFNEDPPSVSFEAYNEGDLTVSVNGLAEKGTIKNGQLSITLGTPTSLDNLEDVFNDDDMTVSSSSAKGFALSTLSIDNSDGRQNLGRMNYTIVGTTSETQEMVYYFYVDTNVTISSKEKTKTLPYYGTSYTYTTTEKAFSLALKTGWNTFYIKMQTSIKESTNTIERITTVSLGNPSSLKWVLGFSGDEGSGDEEGGSGEASEPGDPTGNYLTGTTWMANKVESSVEEFIYTLEFKSASEWTMNTKVIKGTDEESEDLVNGNYTVSGSTVVLYCDDDGEWPDDGLSGEINGNTLTLTYDDETLTFTRQDSAQGQSSGSSKYIVPFFNN